MIDKLVIILVSLSFTSIVISVAASSTMDKITVLITGTSRGIGYGLCETFLSAVDKNYVVHATCRDTTNDKLLSLQSRYKDKLYIHELDVTKQESHALLYKKLVSNGVDAIDVLIANAGIASSNHPVDPILTAPIDDMLNVYNTNVIGSLLTLQTYTPLLLKSKTKLFCVLSSKLASIEQNTIGGYTSYRSSKAALNMLAKTFSEDSTIKSNKCKVLCLHPGWAQTEMGESNNRKAPVEVATSCNGIKRVIDKSLSIQHGHTTTATVQVDDRFSNRLLESDCVFVGYDEELLPW